MTGAQGQKRKSQGRPLAIPLDHEERLANCPKTMEKWGFGLSKTAVLDIVEDITNNKIKTQFKKNRPGHEWFISFKKRHQGIKYKNAASRGICQKKYDGSFRH